MTNEIKEILEALKPHSDIVKEYPLTLSIEEQKILLDYITNLQENLANYVNVVLHNRKVIDNLQQRIDQVLEYIKEHTIHDTPKKLSNGIYERGELIRTCDFYIEDLLDILRGDE